MKSTAFASIEKMKAENPATMRSDLETCSVAIRRSYWRRHRWLKWVAGALLAMLVGLAAIVAVLARRAEPFLRARIVEELQDRFHARVELDSFHVTLGNSLEGQWGLWAEGKGLRVWPPAQVAGVSVSGAAEQTGPGTVKPPQPLVELAEFRFHAPLRYEPGQPIPISLVRLKELKVDLPPKSHFGHGQAGAEQSKSGGGVLRFDLDSVECSGADLTLETSKPGKLPMEIAIARFKLTNVGGAGAMGFEAELTNPRPVGTIHTKGTLGASHEADLGEDPIRGDYRFEHADLAAFKGIAGILSSTGHYEGTLRDLVVDGETDTPEFRLRPFDNPLPLHTKFHAKVDGTNGDTCLQPVEATLGHSHFEVHGQIVRVPVAGAGGVPQSGGHDIALNVDVDRARIEDFLHLASRGDTPMLTGALTMKAALHIPPGTPEGSTPVHERMQLKGSFALDQAQFTSEKVQDRIEELSERGQGRPRDAKTADPAAVRSRMEGDFQMAGGVITLPSLTYTVPGATIQLKGTYGVEGGTLDFAGSAKMEATVSQMVGGWKGMLLKPLDRRLEKNGAGTEVQIHINGTREQPEFGVDFGRMKMSLAAHP